MSLEKPLRVGRRCTIKTEEPALRRDDELIASNSARADGRLQCFAHRTLTPLVAVVDRRIECIQPQPQRPFGSVAILNVGLRIRLAQISPQPYRGDPDFSGEPEMAGHPVLKTLLKAQGPFPRGIPLEFHSYLPIQDARPGNLLPLLPGGSDRPALVIPIDNKNSWGRIHFQESAQEGKEFK